MLASEELCMPSKAMLEKREEKWTEKRMEETRKRRERQRVEHIFLWFTPKSFHLVHVCSMLRRSSSSCVWPTAAQHCCCFLYILRRRRRRLSDSGRAENTPTTHTARVQKKWVRRFDFNNFHARRMIAAALPALNCNRAGKFNFKLCDCICITRKAIGAWMGWWLWALARKIAKKQNDKIWLIIFDRSESTAIWKWRN